MKQTNRIWVAIATLSMVFAQTVEASEEKIATKITEVIEKTTNKEKPSELNVAISKGDFGKVQQLVGAGTNVNQKDSSEKTPLMYAVLYKKSEIVTYLIQNGASVRAVDVRGFSVMDYALDSNSEEIVQQIKQARKKK